MARKFFYICAGMFLLVLSYHLGASTATAQGSGSPVVALVTETTSSFSPGTLVAVTADGQCYLASGGDPFDFHPRGNVFAGGTTAVHQESWGQLKARYRSAPGTTLTPGADNR